MYTLGYDIGSSSVKAVLLNGETGKVVASAYSPKNEMPMSAKRIGWAEQEPSMWWDHLKLATAQVLSEARIQKDQIIAIGISYQMHGLVIIDKNQNVLRPSIIWCDSRAVEIGNKAFKKIGAKKCLGSLMNSPGNFTASKLRWVKEHEPVIFRKIDKFMLPGDYIAMKLTGEVVTTRSGLSEGILWDFKLNAPASFLLKEYGIPSDLIPPLTPTFGEQGRLHRAASQELGLPAGIPVTYRAGDQPNNALSLNVMEPGEIAATAGTSGVVYGVSGTRKYDPASRVNSFAHVNHSPDSPRIGVLLCINGTGIANSWIRRMTGQQSVDYARLNEIASAAPVGSDGVVVLPFGNGAERMLENRDIGAQILNLHFNIHTQAHLARAVQEGIAFAFNYGIDIMHGMNIKPKVIRAGFANLFLSPIFADTLAQTAGVSIELYSTDGAQGAARGAALGINYFKSRQEAFKGLKRLKTIEPHKSRSAQYQEFYHRWSSALERTLQSKG
ncbi:MAG: carbohydrate kinase [Ignavibacteriae bacterium]|nr:MAG: carbohydrate kinase [Ignavibacteriota bacterium]